MAEKIKHIHYLVLTYGSEYHRQEYFNNMKEFLKNEFYSPVIKEFKLYDISIMEPSNNKLLEYFKLQSDNKYFERNIDANLLQALKEILKATNYKPISIDNPIPMTKRNTKNYHFFNYVMGQKYGSLPFEK